MMDTKALIRRLRVEVDILRSPELPIGGCAKAISDIADALAAQADAQPAQEAVEWMLPMTIRNGGPSHIPDFATERGYVEKHRQREDWQPLYAHPPAQPGPVAGQVAELVSKRWPFVESPGEFTSRLEVAYSHFGNLLAAVRNVLIENPPLYAAPQPAQPQYPAMPPLPRYEEVPTVTGTKIIVGQPAHPDVARLLALVEYWSEKGGYPSLIDACASELAATLTELGMKP